MKLRLLLCGAAVLVAGCAAPQNPFASSGEYSYTYDLVPQPVPELSPAVLAKINELPVAGATVAPSSALSQTDRATPYVDH